MIHHGTVALESRSTTSCNLECSYYIPIPLVDRQIAPDRPCRFSRGPPCIRPALVHHAFPSARHSGCTSGSKYPEKVKRGLHHACSRHAALYPPRAFTAASFRGNRGTRTLRERDRAGGAARTDST
ncbi:hypothetical protein PUN28_009582 [Cardiocondyla obscurior]|uniref:Uncharacterized protein n=1 Tax=Cardiocondyla obscurior TaxID=286306 RepID=A0AAW2FYG9_9HYME